MTDLVPDISADAFTTQRDLTAKVLLERDPTLDLTPGAALDGLLVENEAHLASLQASQLEQARLASSLQAVVDGDVQVSDAEVDLLVSNYFITRRPAVAATGPVRVVVSAEVSYQLPRGFAFTVGQLVFRTTEVIKVYSTSVTDFVETSGSRRLYRRSDGQFEFTVAVTADEASTAARLTAGTTMVIAAPLAGMVGAAAAADFTGGQPAETNAELLARVQGGITAKTFGGEDHIRAALSAQFPGIVVRVLGAGSPLMLRDRANILGVSTLGKQDIWFRVSAAPSTKTLTVTATVLSGVQRRLGFSLPANVADGVYRVVAIRPSGSALLGGDAPDQVSRGVSYGSGYRPAYPTERDVAFTAHQQLNVQYIDTLTPGGLTDGAQVTIEVDVTYMASTASVTDFTLDPGRRWLGNDVAVRAAVPCLVTGTLGVQYRQGTTAPDLTKLRRAIVDAMAALPLGTARLTTYLVNRAAATVLGSNAEVTSVALRGVINAPAGETNLSLPVAQDLEIPWRPDLLVGPDNTFFAATPESFEVILVAQ